MTGRTWLVTGGTGSLGQRLVRRILDRHDPIKVIIYSRDEYKQVEMARRLADERCRYIIGDVRNTEALTRAMCGVDYCIHTAALKHVDKAEYNPEEYVSVNLNGTISTGRACATAGVTRAVMLSTDKSCMPINLYGASKACAEKCWLAFCAQYRPIYSVARYGNVIDSRGSVLERWREQAGKNCRHFSVTDDSMTRFAMTFDMALDLIECALLGPPQAVYVAKAPTYRLLDLVIALDGTLERMGARPGEKKHEILMHRYESVRARDMGRYYRITPETPADTAIDYTEEGFPVVPDWDYASNTATPRLSVEELRELIAKPDREGWWT
jgi:UDP-N-acetylglucosamine 4,6-dehydratase